MSEKEMLVLEKREEGLNPRQIRAKGNIPVTVYGKGLESLSLQVDLKKFITVKNSKFVQSFKAKIRDKEEYLIIKAIEKNPVTDQILNVQLHTVAATDRVTLTVPIVYTGSSPLVQAGGILFINKKTVEINAKANAIPSSIEFDLAELQISKNIAYYSDLKMPKDVQLKSQAEQIIIKVSMPEIKAEETTTPAKKK